MAWRRVHRIVLGALLATGLIGSSAVHASPAAAPYCAPDQPPAFVLGFRALADTLGPTMGAPLECEHANPANGDALQQTSTGLAFYRQRTNTPTFTNGWEHWALTAEGLVTWTGDSVDPPGLAVPAEPPPGAEPAPLPVAALPPAGPDERFGVILNGLTDDGYDAPERASDILRLLGLRTWYSFSAGAPDVPDTLRLELARPPTPAAQLAGRAARRPGAVWLLGNEPNVPGQDDIDPGAFASWYHDAATAIRAVDPAARLVAPNVLNWDVTCTRCAGYTTGRGWSGAFLAAYRAQHALDPPIDIWGLHDYSLDWEHTPLANPPESWEQIEAARAWLDADPGLAGKPIWITEFGVVFGFDAYRVLGSGAATRVYPTGEWRQDVLDSYVREMVGWLTTRGAELGVERWFLYSALPAQEPYQVRPAGIALLRGPSGALALTSEAHAYLGRDPAAVAPGRPVDAPGQPMPTPDEAAAPSPAAPPGQAEGAPGEAVGASGPARVGP